MGNDKSHSNSSTTALITAAGIVFGAAITNLDTVVRVVKGTQAVTAEYSGYRPTGRFETEFRYHLDISGARADMESFEAQFLEAFRQELVDEDPEAEDDIDALIDIITEEAPRFDEVLELMLPIYKRHYTVEEIQELNRFYSTAPMQNMVRKDSVINAELAPLIVRLQQDYIDRVAPAIMELVRGN